MGHLYRPYGGRCLGCELQGTNILAERTVNCQGERRFMVITLVTTLIRTPAICLVRWANRNQQAVRIITGHQTMKRRNGHLVGVDDSWHRFFENPFAQLFPTCGPCCSFHLSYGVPGFLVHFPISQEEVTESSSQWEKNAKTMKSTKISVLPTR